MKASVDIGFGYTKAMNELRQKEISFPSLIANRYKTNNLGMSTKEEYIVNYKNSLFAVGKEALKSMVTNMKFTETRFIEDFSKILTLTALYQLECDEEVELALGLPLSIFPKYYEKVKDTFEYMEETIIINGNAKRYHIKRCEVYPQGLGALMSVDEKLPQGIVAIIDVGYKTTDALLVSVEEEGLSPLVDFCFSLDEGTSRILEMLGIWIEKKFDVVFETASLMNIFDKDKITVRSRQVDIKEMKESIYKTVATSIIEKIESKWLKNYNMIDKFYIAGGGANIILDTLKETEIEATIVNNPQFANCKGFLRLLEATSTEE